MTPKFIRLIVGPAPGSTDEGRRASLDPDAGRPVRLLAAARRCRRGRRRGGPALRDQDIEEHVACEQDAAVREEDRGVADGVRLMRHDFAWDGPRR